MAGKHETRRRATQLRNDMNKAEWLLWLRLRNRQVGGLKFRRQHPIGPYVADFACLSEKLVIELDGASHEGFEARDRAKDDYLISNGWRVMRLQNSDVYEDELDSLGHSILAFLKEPA